MSKQIETTAELERAAVTLTQFWGGEDKGLCIQVTAPARDRQSICGSFVQLTPREAALVAVALTKWAAQTDLAGAMEAISGATWAKGGVE